MPRPVNYPLDVTARFTLDQYNDFHTTLRATGTAAEFLQNSEGDLHTWVVFDAVREVWQRAYVTEAYADLIDANVASIQDETTGLKAELSDLQARVASLQQTCESLATSLAQVSGFLGVVIPAWLNKKEVEQGDDMRLSRPPATELGLTVVYADARQVAGFGQDDVVALDPPAGTLVARGTTVTVTLDIEG